MLLIVGFLKSETMNILKNIIVGVGTMMWGLNAAVTYGIDFKPSIY